MQSNSTFHCYAAIQCPSRAALLQTDTAHSPADDMSDIYADNGASDLSLEIPQARVVLPAPTGAVMRKKCGFRTSKLHCICEHAMENQVSMKKDNLLLMAKDPLSGVCEDRGQLPESALPHLWSRNVCKTFRGCCNGRQIIHPTL